MLLIPLTVVLAANLFFEEHDYDTLKNLMCVPVTKGRLTMAKLFVLLIFDIAYEAAGYMIAAAMSVISGIRLEEAGQQLILTWLQECFYGLRPCPASLLWCGVTNPILFQ